MSVTEMNKVSVNRKVNIPEALAFELFDNIAAWILHL